MYRESLQNNRDIILLSKKLATIHTDVPVDLNLDALAAKAPDSVQLRELYTTMEFRGMMRDLAAQDPIPAEERKTDFQSFVSEQELNEWFKGLSAEAPLAVAATEVMEQAVLGFSATAASGRSVSLAKIPDRAMIAHDIKALVRKFGECPNLKHDVMLYGFLITAEPTGCDLPKLTEKYLGYELDHDPAAQACAVWELFQKLRPMVEAEGLAKVYDEIDLPMIRILARMEETGVRADPAQLGVLSRHMETELSRLTAEIYELARKPFNINSPQQLGKVLFEDLGLPAPKTAKGKSASTAADVLEDLSGEYPIAAKILEYRQLAKLKGTYVDALPLLMNTDTGRVHTTFNQTGAATGRLSSSNPNLQNIPIRTELGREIRATFVPREGWKLVVADYSQIELRLLAHMSRDKVLVEAFRNGEDIHTRTAAEVFGVPPLMITSEQRRNAKAVNFGIVYGQTAFGLAMALGIDRKEAERYIKAYFERYIGVKRFIEATIADVRRTGFAINMYGRKRPIPDIKSANPNARGFAERTAVNTPLQGTAADLIKLAMIRIDIKLQKMQARMLLQVHDELVFEAPPEEVNDLCAMVKSEMEGVQKLEVPLIADVGVGDNWRDAK